jgi:hypothetical protein
VYAGRGIEAPIHHQDGQIDEVRCGGVVPKGINYIAI